MKPSSKDSVSQIPNNLPPTPNPFVNREAEIRQAINALLDSKVSVVALVGMAGIGKTCLALEIAHRLLGMGEFTDGIIWLPASNLRSSDDLTSAVRTALDISGTEAYTRLNSQQCLIVLDGLDELSQQHETLVDRFLEVLPAPSKALVTSRKSLEILPPNVVIEIDALDEQAAIELFTLWGQRQREVSSAERQTATEVVRALGNHPLALTLAARLVRGDYAEARKLFDQASDILDELGNEQERAALLHTLASVAQAQGDYSQALQLYQQSLEIEEQLSDLQGKSATLNNLAQIYFARGEYDRALALYQESLAILEQIGDIRGKATTLNNLAQIYFTRGELDRALAFYQESLAILEQLSDLSGKSALLHNIAQLYASRGEVERALSLYKESLAISKKIGDRYSEARTSSNLGLLYRDQGDLERAVETLEHSQNEFAAIGLVEHPIVKTVRITLANVANELAKHYVEQGRWYDALHLFEESLVIYRQGDDLDVRADTIYQIARIHHLLGNLDKARTHYRDALRLYEHTQNQSGIATCKTGLGRLMIQMGFLDDAISELESARQTYLQLGADQRTAEIEEVLQIANHVKEKQRI
jgi:tetratricopeptide (TPR) repeat protein